MDAEISNSYTSLAYSCPTSIDPTHRDGGVRPHQLFVQLAFVMTEMFDRSKDNTHSEPAGWPKGKRLPAKLRYRRQNRANFIISRIYECGMGSSGWKSKMSIILKQFAHVVPILSPLVACSVTVFLTPFFVSSLTHNNAI